MSDEDRINRRRFFREGLRGLIDKIGQAAGPMQRVMKELEGLHKEVGSDLTATPSAATPAWATPTEAHPPTTPISVRRTVPKGDRYLRPPGAKEEADFVSTCSTCGECVKVCPVQCIHIEPGRAGSVPFIIADESPCVLCDGLLCMYNCPTGAITAIPIGLIDMGTAVWNEERCVRSQGTECTMCVDRCPIGNRAIELIDGKIAVNEEGCTGCGVCEKECPTSPRSIIVAPAATRD